MRNAAPKKLDTPVTVTRTSTLAPLVGPARSATVPARGVGVSGVKTAVGPDVVVVLLPPPHPIDAAARATKAVVRTTLAAERVGVRCGIIGVSGIARLRAALRIERGHEREVLTVDGIVQVAIGGGQKTRIAAQRAERRGDAEHVQSVDRAVAVDV